VVHGGRTDTDCKRNREREKKSGFHSCNAIVSTHVLEGTVGARARAQLNRHAIEMVPSYGTVTQFRPLQASRHRSYRQSAWYAAER
jgi:hypothetical protein